MSLALGFVALAIVGGEPEADRPKGWVGFTLRTVDAPALEWRKLHHYGLKPVGRQGACQVWTTATAEADSIRYGGGSEFCEAPRVSAAQGSRAVVDSRATRELMTGVTRLVSGPAGPIVDATFIPRKESIPEGYTASIAGRLTENGIAVSLDYRGSWIAEVKEIRTSDEVGPGVRARCVATIQVPEIHDARLLGEWTLAEGESLVISNGILARGPGRESDVERLTIVEVQKVPEPDVAVIPASFTVESSSDVPIAKAADAVPPIPERPSNPLAFVGRLLRPKRMPPLPSRSLLPAIAPDGRDVSPAPAAPADEMVVATSDGSSIPRPSPQSPSVSGPVRRDPNVSATSYEPSPVGRSSLPTPPKPDSSSTSIVIPIGSRGSIEVNARLISPTSPR